MPRESWPMRVFRGGRRCCASEGQPRDDSRREPLNRGRECSGSWVPRPERLRNLPSTPTAPLTSGAGRNQPVSPTLRPRYRERVWLPTGVFGFAGSRPNGFASPPPSNEKSGGRGLVREGGRGIASVLQGASPLRPVSRQAANTL